ncbi:hypothetical protein BC940DRAFT_288156 [Gongronella butleri]|nr:hypothetical protein BC940DRAFT_288156 [Gongronella butleri]
MGRPPRSLLSLFAVGALQLVGLLLFVRGFFPYKTYLPGFAHLDSVPAWLDDKTAHPVLEPEFDRLVFIVIDALRNDFVFDESSGFSFVHSLVEQGSALLYTARADAPTVTMPRIKALTTGTVPSFLDAILNIAESDTSSSLAHHDNWVRQFHQNGSRTIHFFGDDTWIRLFPGLFTKTDGTTSFYVTDTVQVDVNVTRHIEPDLGVSDWDAVIMHYLGLDHVGHLGGPKSPLMLPKQQEMDRAIESVYHLVAQQDAERLRKDAKAKGTLVVVCGDHGMNDAGNHGGSSLGETSTAMLFASPRFYSRPVIRRANKESALPSALDYERDRDVFGYPVIDQVDLVPTLSLLFGVPIPKNNLGSVILPLFDRHATLSNERAAVLLRALQLNAHQLNQLWPNDKKLDVATELHHAFVNRPSRDLAVQAINAYTMCITEAKEVLSDTASNYDLSSMMVGTLILIGTATRMVRWARDAVVAESSMAWTFVLRIIVVLVAAYSLSVFASSFVEEEHQIWSYWLQTLFLVLAGQSFFVAKPMGVQVRLALLMVAQLVLVRAGMEWQGIHGSPRWHLLSAALAQPLVMQAMVMVSMPMQRESRWIQLLCKVTLVAVSALTSALVMAYKLRHEGDNLLLEDHAVAMYGSLLKWELVRRLDQVELGQLIYNYGATSCLILTLTIYVTKRAMHLTMLHGNQDTPLALMRPYVKLLLHAVTPLLVLLSRPQHSVYFLQFTVQLELLLAWQRTYRQNNHDERVPAWIKAFLVLCLVHYGFFITDHGNTLAHVDLGLAYTGVSDYDPWKISILTFCSNWSGAIWWCIAGWAMLVDDEKQETSVMAQEEEEHAPQGDTDGPEDEQDEHDDLAQQWIAFSVVLASVFSVTLATLSISVTILREHLFIWTVFSPKYLYQLAWHVMFFWGTHMVLGALVVLHWHTWSAPTRPSSIAPSSASLDVAPPSSPPLSPRADNDTDGTVLDDSL